MNYIYWVVQGVKAILAILDRIAQVVVDTPPVDNSASRFGNPAFRTFYDKVAEVRISFFVFFLYSVYSDEASRLILVNSVDIPVTTRNASESTSRVNPRGISVF